MNRWPMVPLGEVSKQIERAVAPIPGTRYRQIGVKLWGEGAYERESIDGGETKYSTLRIAREGDIIVNKIWARNGSVAVVPKQLDGCVGSNEFPMYTVNSEVLLPRWVHWLTKTKGFWEQCDAKSRGTSGKNRIRPEKFLEIEIPLPPLREQRRLVERIDALAAKIEEAKGLRHDSILEAEALLKSTRRRLIGANTTSTWVPLSTFVQEIENGWSPPCEKRPASNDEWAVLKVGAVSFGQYDPRENKALPASLAAKPEYEVKVGDFIMSRANTYELVGACAVVEKTPPRLMLSDKHFRFIFRSKNAVDLGYLNHVLKSPALRTQIVAGATGTSPTMKNISKAKVLGLLIPRHDLAEQRRLTTKLDDIQKQTKLLYDMQDTTGKKLNALLPAILDRAFRGELP